MQLDEIVACSTLAIGVVGQYFVSRYIQKEHGRSINILFKWKDSHEKDSNSYKSQNQENIAELRTKLALNSNSVEQILKILEEVRLDIRELLKKKGV